MSDVHVAVGDLKFREKCPFCFDGTMRFLQDGKVAIIPLHGEDRVGKGQDGYRYIKLGKAQYGGNYLSGFVARVYRCDNCGYMALFSETHILSPSNLCT
jgi:hypothetical protein